MSALPRTAYRTARRRWSAIDAALAATSDEQTEAKRGRDHRNRLEGRGTHYIGRNLPDVETRQLKAVPRHACAQLAEVTKQHALVDRKIKRHILVPTGTGSPEPGGTPESFGGVLAWPNVH
ncbi:MAG: hypothetical protein ABI434_16710 [Burkholderiaceae bacterium]